jgi:hypothetical protein
MIKGDFQAIHNIMEHGKRNSQMIHIMLQQGILSEFAKPQPKPRPTRKSVPKESRA